MSKKCSNIEKHDFELVFELNSTLKTRFWSRFHKFIDAQAFETRFWRSFIHVTSKVQIGLKQTAICRGSKYIITQRYRARIAPYMTFPTHHQPYRQHTPNRLDPLPNRLHKSEMSKDKKVIFSNFLFDASKFRYSKKILAICTT